MRKCLAKAGHSCDQRKTSPLVTLNVSPAAESAEPAHTVARESSSASVV